jgi:hypothetical protein
MMSFSKFNSRLLCVLNRDKWFFLLLFIFALISSVLYHYNHLFFCGVTSSIAFDFLLIITFDFFGLVRYNW